MRTCIRSSCSKKSWKALSALLLLCVSGWAADCSSCHAKQVELHANSPHARALARVDSETLAAWRTVRERTGVEIAYRRPATVITSGADSETVTAVLEWVFGTGRKARTLVGRHDGSYFEHRLSWYRENNRLGLTPGHPPRPAETPVEALGVPQHPFAMERCFGCHATNVRLEPEGFAFTPGIQCERCHGDGSRHSADQSPRSILGLKRLSAQSSVQFCAGCHRMPDREYNSAAPEVEDPLSVRFQPVGLMASRCFTKSGKLSCVTCHDPHAEMKPASDVSYRAACRSCHAAATRSGCDRRTKPASDCVSCHMQRSSPAPNLTFTDHRIRVYPK